MGCKKLKKKKFKKLEKYHKLKTIKQKISILPDSPKEFQRNLEEKNITDRLSRSRSCDMENNISDTKYFSQVRESYFSHLQRVICDNCVFYDSLVTEKILEDLALELEQNALLACLQVDIYKKSMSEIIRDIKTSTEKEQVHKDVKRLLPDSSQEKTNEAIIKNSTTILSESETFNKIPIIASNRVYDNLANESNLWEESSFNPDLYYSVSDYYQEIFPKTQNDTQIINGHSWVERDYFLMPCQTNYCCNELPQTNKNDVENLQNMTCSNSSVTQNNFCNLSDNHHILESTPNEIKKNSDPLLESRNQLQKSVEQNLIQTERVNKHKQDEQERAYITQILEDDDSLGDKLNDSLSDNENEFKENIDESNLIDRLEKMKDFFGLEEQEQEEQEEEGTKTNCVPRKQKESNKAIHINSRNRLSTVWKYEKFIQLHKYSIIAAEMTFEKREINRRIFLDLFGEDSDEEHEMEYSSTEKYRTSCTERISSWVVKYLMPFYHEKRIIGRNLFKSLGHYISDTIVDKIQYPDEWTVKYFVSKFFPPKKKYVCDADIFNFQLN